MRSQLINLRSQLTNLRSQLTNLRSQLTNLRSQLINLRSQLNNWRSQLTNLQSFKVTKMAGRFAVFVCFIVMTLPSSYYTLSNSSQGWGGVHLVSISRGQGFCSVKPDVSSASPSSEREGVTLTLTLETSAVKIPVRWSFYIINNVDKTKFLFTTPPLTQHHSFFRNYPYIQERLSK